MTINRDIPGVERCDAAHGEDVLREARAAGILPKAKNNGIIRRLVDNENRFIHVGTIEGGRYAVYSGTRGNHARLERKCFDTLKAAEEYGEMRKRIYEEYAAKYGTGRK